VTVGRRSQVDARLVEELAAGATLAKAAEAAGCAVRTAERRYAEPAFRARVTARQEEDRKERQALRWQVWGLGERLAGTSLQALQATLQDPHASHRDKHRAAKILLDQFGPPAEPLQPHVPTLEQEQSAELGARLLAQLDQATRAALSARPRSIPAPPAWSEPPSWPDRPQATEPYPQPPEPVGQDAEDALEEEPEFLPAEVLPEPEEVLLPEPEPELPPGLADAPVRPHPSRRRRGEVADVRWQVRDRIRRAGRG
jgi:hypothetical protein